MALNFPSNPVDKQYWTDPSNGVTYQYQVDPLSPSGQGKWVTNLGSGSQADEVYLRLDATNGPVTNSLGIRGFVEFNENGPQSFISPLTRGTQGQALISGGDGTTTWGNAGGSVSIGPTPPAFPNDGDLWFNPVDGRLYIWYTDSNSSQWVDVTGSSGPQFTFNSIGLNGLVVQGSPIVGGGTLITSLDINSLGALP